MEKILIGENIWKKYGTKDILKQVSLHVCRGEIYGLLGENGAGKTSLLKIIAKLIPKTRYLGDVQYKNSGRIFSLIGSPSCYLDLSVEENLKLCTILSKENKKE